MYYAHTLVCVEQYILVCAVHIFWNALHIFCYFVCLFDLGLTSLSTFFSHIATVPGCGRELNAHF